MLPLGPCQWPPGRGTGALRGGAGRDRGLSQPLSLFGLVHGTLAFSPLLVGNKIRSGGEGILVAAFGGNGGSDYMSNHSMAVLKEK